MSALSKLKLVSAQAERRSPAISRRNKLTSKLLDQIAAANAATAGGIYAAKRVKFVQDSESGERKQVEIATRVKQWWWKAPTGKIMLALRYGSKPIELWGVNGTANVTVAGPRRGFDRAHSRHLCGPPHSVDGHQSYVE